MMPLFCSTRPAGLQAAYRDGDPGPAPAERTFVKLRLWPMERKGALPVGVEVKLIDLVDYF